MTMSLALCGAGVVQSLVGHAGGQRAVADHGDDPVAAAGEVPDDGHSERGRDRCRRMRGAEGIELALAALGEAGKPAGRAQRVDAVTAARQDLVRVGLMSHVPNQPIARRVEDVVQRHRQLDDAEARAEVAARPGDRANGFRTQFISNSPEIRRARAASAAQDY